MTEEQIKQNAEAYADNIKVIRGKLERCATRDDFIAGAHSRDEEIATLEGLLKIKEHEIKQLRNPWKDASMEKPPYDTDCDDETSVCVIVRQEQGNVLEAYYDYDNNDWRDREHNWRLQDPTHWMFTPEV